MAPPIFLILILVNIWILILVILFYKITLYPPHNIIDYFKSNTIVTNFSIIFLQSIEIANSY